MQKGCDQLHLYFKGKKLQSISRHPFPRDPEKGVYRVTVTEELVDCLKCRDCRDRYNEHLSKGEMNLFVVKDGECGYWCNNCQGTGRAYKDWPQAMLDLGFEAEYNTMCRDSAIDRIDDLKRSLLSEGYNLGWTLTKCDIPVPNRIDAIMEEIYDC
jgi:hypothetical protein